MTPLPSIIAVDFDGTCVTHEYPKVGREIGAAPVLHELVQRGCKLILWTMRSDDRPDGSTPLTDAVKWFESHGIPLWGIQRNPEQNTWTSSPKTYAKLYIDDAALGAPLCPGLKGERPFIDWDAVRRLLLPDTVEMSEMDLLEDQILTLSPVLDEEWRPTLVSYLKRLRLSIPD